MRHLDCFFYCFSVPFPPWWSISFEYEDSQVTYGDSQRVRKESGQAERQPLRKQDHLNVQRSALQHWVSLSWRKRLSAARTCSGFSSGARPLGRQLWLKQVSRYRQAPSRRRAFPGTSRTLGYLCLRFYTHSPQPSTATGQPHSHMCSGAWERQAQSSSRQPSRCCLPTPGF